MKRKKTLANALLLARVMRRSPQHPLARGQVRDTTNTEAASDAVAAQSEVDRLTRLTRSRERHATQSRRKREETQMQIDTLRQDCGRLNASNLHLWHHNKHLQNLIHKAENVVHEHARNTEIDVTSRLMVNNNVGVLEEVVPLLQELQCLNQRINGFPTAAPTTSNLTSSRGTHTVANMGDRDDATHQHVCQDATQIWQALLLLEEQALISRQGNNLLAAAQPGHLQVATTGPTTAGAFQPAGVPQSWLQSGQMQQGPGTGSYARQPNLLAAAPLPPQVTPWSVPLPSQMQLLPGAAGSAILHPHVLAAIHGYPATSTRSAQAVPHRSMIGHGHPVHQQLGLPTTWGHPHVAVDSSTTAASIFLPTVAQSVLLMPPSGQMQQQQLSASGTTAASSSSGPAPADAVPASSARQPDMEAGLSPQMLYILQRMRMTTTGLQHPPAPPGA